MELHKNSFGTNDLNLFFHFFIFLAAPFDIREDVRKKQKEAETQGDGRDRTADKDRKTSF